MTIIVKPRLQQACEPQQWPKGLDKSGILNLMDISHFGLSNEVNICVKLLLRCVQNTVMWLNEPIEIDS